MSGGFPIEFGRYRLVDLLAVGGMAELFLAEITGDHGFAKRVVIKRILPHLAADAQFTQMFISEAKITAKLSHPKIAQTFRLGQEHNQLYIEMEYVDGLDVLGMLRECAHRKVRLAAEVSIFIIMEILDALDYAHNATGSDGAPLGIVHRDISPSNVLVSRRGDIKLVDFGIAHAQAKDQKTQTGTLKGKYGYMAPEQVVGQGVTTRSDLFSVGVVLAEMLLGRRLFAAPNELDVLLMVRDVRLDRLERYGAHIPEDLEPILRKALSKDPEQRFHTAREMHEVLDEWMYENRHRVTSSRVAELVDELFEDADKRRQSVVQDAAERVVAESIAQAAAAEQATPIAVREEVHSAQMKVAEVPLPSSGLKPPSTPPPPPRGNAIIEQSTDEDVERAFNLTLDQGDDNAAAAPVAPVADQVNRAIAAAQPIAPELSGPTAVPVEEPKLAGAAAIADLEIDLAPSGTDSHQASWDDMSMDEIEVDLGALEGSESVPGLELGPSVGSEDEDSIPELLEEGAPDGGFPSIIAAVASVEPPARDPAARDFDDTDVSGLAEPGADIRSGDFNIPTPSELARAPKPTMPPAQEISESPAQEGDLATTSPIRVLHRLLLTRADGMLVMSVGGVRKEIFVKDGVPTFVSSNVASELLGNYLVSKEAISSGELDMALAMMPHFGGKLGDTLVGLGLMKPLDVFRMLNNQVVDKLVDVCTWTKGSYTWYPWRENHRESFPLDIDALAVLGKGAMKLSEDFVDDWFDAHKSEKANRAQPPAFPPAHLAIGAHLLEILDAVDGTASVEQVIASLPNEAARLDGRRALFLFTETSLVSLE